MLKLLPIAALFAGAQAQDVADPISGLTCNLVNRNDGRNLNDVSSTSPYKMGWAFSFATSADGEQGALDTYINPDGWKLDSNCTIRTADDMGLIERRDYCKKVCWLGGAFSRNEANLNKWEDALNNLESSNDCRTETCLNSMMDSVKTFVAGSDELTQGSTTRQVYEARSDGRPQKIIVKYDTRRRLSDLHRRLSEDERPSFMHITGMYESTASAPVSVAAQIQADNAATNNAYLNSIQYSSGTLEYSGMTWTCSGGSNVCAPTARRLSESEGAIADKLHANFLKEIVDVAGPVAENMEEYNSAKQLDWQKFLEILLDMDDELICQEARNFVSKHLFNRTHSKKITIGLKLAVKIIEECPAVGADHRQKVVGPSYQMLTVVKDEQDIRDFYKSQDQKGAFQF